MDETRSGVGDDGTIPASSDGVAVGVGEDENTFEPEEDPEASAPAEDAGRAIAGSDQDLADPSAASDADPAKPHPDHHNAETEQDTVSGGPA